MVFFGDCFFMFPAKFIMFSRLVPMGGGLKRNFKDPEVISF